jgi:hypothetical protein
MVCLGREIGDRNSVEAGEEGSEGGKEVEGGVESSAVSGLRMICS